LFGSNPVPDKYCNKTHFNRFIICQLKWGKIKQIRITRGGKVSLFWNFVI
jgi:hypothetical protein